MSGKALVGLAPLDGCCEGFSTNSKENRALAEEFVFGSLGVDPKLFRMDGGFPVYYGANYCHAELRGPSKMPMMRPSHAFKLVLKSAIDHGVFFNKELAYGYHGTPPQCIKSILSTKIAPSKNGAVGPGIYFSPSPLYAQLYSSSTYHCAKPTTWKSKAGKTYFVDTLLQIRYQRHGCEFHDAIDEISATVGSKYCVHKLFATAKMDIEHMIIARMPTKLCEKGVHTQALIVKFHEKNPYEAGGEWSKIVEMGKKISS